MPRTPKKFNKRAPGGRSSLSRVFAEAIDDGLAQARGDYDDDVEEEDDEEQIDDEAYEYTVEAKQQREQREADKRRAVELHQLVDRIGELNRELASLDAPMLQTPAADEFGDAEMIDGPAFEHARQRLQGEIQQLQQAIVQAREQREERVAAAERGRRIRERIAALRSELRELTELWELKAPATPVADKYEECGALDEKAFNEADGGLQGEEQTVRRVLDHRRQQDAQSQIKAAEAKGRAKTFRKLVEDYYVTRRKLEERAGALGLSMIQEPLAFAEYRAEALGQVPFNTLKAKVDAAAVGAQLRLDLLNGRPNWSAEGMTKLDGAELQAFDSLQAAVDAKDDSTGYGGLPGDVGTWVEALRKHAKQRMVDIPKEELDEDIRDFYASYNEGQSVPLQVHKQEMEKFARDYEYPPENWAKYKKLYNELKVEERNRNTAPPVVDGRLPLTRLRRVLPAGTTAGQWYTYDQSFDAGNDGVFDYHLSVAFSNEPVRGKAVQMVRITGIHASFKRGNQDRKYWWNVNGATVTANGTSGGAVANSPMHTRANTLLNAMKPRLNLN